MNSFLIVPLFYETVSMVFLISKVLCQPDGTCKLSAYSGMPESKPGKFWERSGKHLFQKGFSREVS